jgi:glycosyltransferase involved in cell wall biosynthesis
MLRRLLSTCATAITAHGSWPRGELEQLLGIQQSGRAVLTVPYGARLRNKIPARDIARKALGIDYGGTLLLFFGMLRKDKGIEFLLQAAGRVRADCKILIAGMPFDWDADEIHRMIRKYHGEDRVLTALGYIPEEAISDYFSAADALVLPYMKHYMGAAGPLKTALGFGKPIIATEVRELSEFLKMSPIGIAVDPENADSLKEGIERFVSLPPSRKEEMAGNSRRLAGMCTWTVVAERFSEIYQSFLNPGGDAR